MQGRKNFNDRNETKTTLKKNKKKKPIFLGLFFLSSCYDFSSFISYSPTFTPPSSPLFYFFNLLTKEKKIIIIESISTKLFSFSFNTL